MDFPYAIEGGSTKKNFWVLNKLYMVKREAILITTLLPLEDHSGIMKMAQDILHVSLVGIM